MAVRSVTLSDGRALVFGSLATPTALPFHQRFVALVPAFSPRERRLIEAMASRMIDSGCVEFCCVGPEAEQLHDSLDVLIEARPAFDVVTTTHADGPEACEYFVWAAGGRSFSLVALVSRHPGLTALLEEQAQRQTSR